MSKLFGILIIVLLVWAGLEIYQKGTSGAFGGILDEMGINLEPIHRNPDGLSLRAERKLREAYQNRYDRAAGRPLDRAARGCASERRNLWKLRPGCTVAATVDRKPRESKRKKSGGAGSRTRVRRWFRTSIYACSRLLKFRPDSWLSATHYRG